MVNCLDTLLLLVLEDDLVDVVLFEATDEFFAVANDFAGEIGPFDLGF